MTCRQARYPCTELNTTVRGLQFSRPNRVWRPNVALPTPLAATSCGGASDSGSTMDTPGVHYMYDDTLTTQTGGRRTEVWRALSVGDRPQAGRIRPGHWRSCAGSHRRESPARPFSRGRPSASATSSSARGDGYHTRSAEADMPEERWPRRRPP